MSEVEAWARESGNLVFRGDGAANFMEVSPSGRWVRNWDNLPADAELLVRETNLRELEDQLNEVTDALEDVGDGSDSVGEAVRSLVARLKELNNPYSPLNQQSGAWRVITKHPLIGPISSLPDGDTYADMVKARLDQLEEEMIETRRGSEQWRKLVEDWKCEWAKKSDELDAAIASPPLPKPNAEDPSHFRFAARMHELADISFDAYQQLMDEADRLERETKAQAAREALVEEMARAGYEAVDEVLANGDPSRLHHWDSFTQGKEHHRIIARALLDDPRFNIERVEEP